jgi:hypothetical protein
MYIAVCTKSAVPMGTGGDVQPEGAEVAVLQENHELVEGQRGTSQGLGKGCPFLFGDGYRVGAGVGNRQCFGWPSHPMAR